jgi:hypothetical protein
LGSTSCELAKQKVNSRNGNNSHLVALRLSNPQKETIQLPNPVDPSKPKISFPYSDQTHLNLEPAKGNKNKYDYFMRVMALGTTPLSDEELMDFLKNMRNTTFGIITSEDNSSHGSPLSYFVYINMGMPANRHR